MQSGIFDKRSAFFKGYFEKALSYADFLSTGTPQQREKWDRFSEKAELNQAQKELCASYKRKLNLLVLAGIWCGDCARQCPMLHKIAEASNVIELRVIDNQTYPELRDELRIAGGTRVPVAVALSEDFFEIERFGDRHLSVYRKKAEKELGAACDAGLLPPPDEELKEELSAWCDKIERVQLILRLSPFLRQRHGD